MGVARAQDPSSKGAEVNFASSSKGWFGGRGRQQVSTSRSYPPVEALQRGMEVLRCVNEYHIATVSDVHAATGYPKPTVVRMLETLIAEGYVARDTLCGGYRTTSKTSLLHSRSSGIAGIIEAARTPVIELTKSLNWPVAIGSLVGRYMSVQFSTAAISPWTASFALGMHLDLFYTAMGRTYLAFCDEDQRERLLQELSAPGGPIAMPGEMVRYRRILAEVQECGYALRGHRQNDRTSSVAMPIRHGGQVRAVASLSYYRSVVPPSSVADSLVPPLSDAVGKTEDMLRQMEIIENAA